MSLIHHDAISLAIEAFSNAGKVLWLLDDASFGEAGPALAGDLRALIGGTAAIAHFIATTSQNGLVESCAAGSGQFIELLGACRQAPGDAASRWPGGALARQEAALAAWQRRPGSVLAIELGALAGSPQLRDLARRQPATVLRCGADYTGAGPGATIALAWPPAACVALLRERLSSSGLIPG